MKKSKCFLVKVFMSKFSNANWYLCFSKKSLISFKPNQLFLVSKDGLDGGKVKLKNKELCLLAIGRKRQRTNLRTYQV